MSFEWDQPEDFGSGGGNFLKTAGTYLFVCHDATTEDKDGKPLDGFRVNCEVLDGTVRNDAGCTEKNKLANITFFNGKPTQKNGGLFARQKQAAFFVAANVITPADIPAITAKQVRPDLAKAQGQMFVATVTINEKGFVELNYADVFHVDDPNASSYPKDAAVLAMIAPQNRRTAAELQAIKDAFAGKPTTASNGSGSYSPPKTFDPSKL